MRHYIGLIHQEAGSDYGVSFPDFPGVVTAGMSLDDAQVMAEEALALHVDGLVEDGEALPVTLPEDILERIDKSATSRGLTRSAFLTRAAKRELETA